MEAVSNGALLAVSEVLPIDTRMKISANHECCLAVLCLAKGGGMEKYQSLLKPLTPAFRRMLVANLIRSKKQQQHLENLVK